MNPKPLAVAVLISMSLMGQSMKEMERQKDKIFGDLYRSHKLKDVVDVEKSRSAIVKLCLDHQLPEPKSDVEFVAALLDGCWPPFQNTVLISREYLGKWERNEVFYRKKDGVSFISIKVDSVYLCIEGHVNRSGVLAIDSAYLNVSPALPAGF